MSPLALALVIVAAILAVVALIPSRVTAPVASVLVALAVLALAGSLLLGHF